MDTYKSETSGTTVMHRLARGYTDEDIALIAAYLTTLDADK
jgi:cytochrome c553